MLMMIGLLTLAATSLLFVGLSRPRPDAVGQRLGLLPSSQVSSSERVQGSLVARALGPGARRVGKGLERLLPLRWIRGIDHMLEMAGEPWSLWGFLSAWLGAAITGIALAMYVALSGGGMQALGPALMIIPIVIAVPYAMLRRRVKARQKVITRSLPNALDLLVTSVEAGMSIDAAFALVVEKSEGPLAETFSLYLRHVGLGRAREEALLLVAERTGVPDLLGIARAASQSEEMGTPLGDVLRYQATELRAVRRQRAEIAAQRAPVLMTIPLALCFLPAMVAVVVVPSVLNLVEFLSGMGGG